MKIIKNIDVCRWCDNNICTICRNAEITESVEDIKSWDRYGKSNVPYTAMVIVVMILSVILVMIFADSPVIN